MVMGIGTIIIFISFGVMMAAILWSAFKGEKG
jgi:hypothetical protein